MSENPDRTVTADHFETLGLPRRLGLAPEALSAAFLRLSRECHPDRFAGAPDGERAEIQRKSARVNDAFRALRDPVARAEHLLVLEEISRPAGEARCPPDLLAEVFELREELAEGARPSAAGRAQALLAGAEEALAALFRAHDEAPEGDRREVLARVREALDRRKFLSSLVREVAETSGSR